MSVCSSCDDSGLISFLAEELGMQDSVTNHIGFYGSCHCFIGQVVTEMQVMQSLSPEELEPISSMEEMKCLVRTKLGNLQPYQRLDTVVHPMNVKPV